MFERFTDPARRVVVLAQEEARERGDDTTRSEHLLLAVCRRSQSESLNTSDSKQNAKLVCLILPIVFLAGTIVMLLRGHLFLTRYAVPLVPFALIVSMLVLQRFKLQAWMLPLLLACCTFFVLNREGRYYPKEYLYR